MKLSIYKIGCFVGFLILFLFLGSIALDQYINLPTVSSHTIYCYEMCKEMVNNHGSAYFNTTNGWGHCVDDCGGYE